ncbi:MAG: hypothetical protein SF069_04810 [Phycisphaerae bacterium]|nr:hypothetical protein [Phycisphaerae bacterium]
MLESNRIHELLPLVVRTLTQHFDTSQLWLPTTGLAVTTLLGVILLFKGAKLAPKLLALALLGVGAVAGSHVAKNFDLPFWPIVGSGAVIGMVFGFALFRPLLAGTLAACAIIGSLTAFANVKLVGPLSNWGRIENPLDVTLKSGTELVPTSAGANVLPDLQRLWTYLSSHPDLPNFQQNFWAIVISTGLAGLIFGLLLPRAARVVWSATMGVLLTGVGLYQLAAWKAPDMIAQATANQQVFWGVVAGVWVLSLIFNWRSMREKRPVITVDEDGGEATA